MNAIAKRKTAKRKTAKLITAKLITGKTTVSALQAELEAEIEAFENDIDKIQVSAAEEWVQIASDLHEIRNRFAKAKEAKEKLFGCKTWAEYCRSDRARYTASHANQMIVSYQLRLQIPVSAETGIVWTEFAVRELAAAKLPSLPLQKSTAKRAVEIAEEKSIPLTTAVRQAAEIIKETKAYQRAAEKAADEKEATAKPAANLRRLLDYTRKHLQAFQEWPASDWTAAEEEEPGITANVADALAQLAEFLRD